MIHLNNIRLENGILSLNYKPDYSEGEYGYIEYDVKTKKCIKAIYCEEENGYSIKRWFDKTMNYLQMNEWDFDIPKEIYYFWY